MNNQLENALTELIEKALSGIDSTVGFLEAEIPDVIFQLLLWHGVYKGIIFSIGLILIILMIVIGIKGYKHSQKFKEEYPRDDESYMFIIFLYGAGEFLLAIPTIFLLNLEWLQILIAPKIWLIEYASKLIK